MISSSQWLQPRAASFFTFVSSCVADLLFALSGSFRPALPCFASICLLAVLPRLSGSELSRCFDRTWVSAHVEDSLSVVFPGPWKYTASSRYDKRISLTVVHPTFTMMCSDQYRARPVTALCVFIRHPVWADWDRLGSLEPSQNVACCLVRTCALHWPLNSEHYHKKQLNT